MKEKMSNFFGDWGRRGWFLLNIFCTVMYLMWRIFFTIPFGYGYISVGVGVALLIVEALGMVESLVHYINMYNVRDYKKPEVDLELFPEVDVFISTYNEPTSLIAKTIFACKRMEYPDQNKVHIYLCDDGHREEMKQLASKMKVNYLDRETHAGQKAGNLNHALANSSSPYIVTFDADMLPQSCFLMETIPYVVDAELKNQKRKPDDQIPLGFIQTPQAFYDLDLFQFNLHSETKIPNEQDYFYRDIEVARTRSNSCIYGGSNTIISRKALEDVGGFYTEGITEDFATGILIQRKGYVSLALGKPLASGVSAHVLQDLIQQRVRWARGVITTGRKMHIFTAKDLSFSQKMNYWASIWYWYAPIKRFLYIMSPILFAVFGFTIFRCTLLEVLIFWLPMYLTSNISLRQLSNNIRNTKWTSIYEYALFPYMIIPVILESFGFSLKKFKVTNKENTERNRKKDIVYSIPILILIVLSIIGILNCIRIMFDSGSIGPMVVLFWLINNLFNMIMCAFFVQGREIYRNAERIQVEIPVKVWVDGRVVYEGITRDISETGVAIYMAKPHLLDSDRSERVILEIADRAWYVKVECEVKYVKEEKNKELPWIYTMEYKNIISENGYDNLLAICYDRVPTKPQEINKKEGFYDDLSNNINKRVAPPFYMKRHYPRIELNSYVPYQCEQGEGQAKIIDFNYVFASISGKPLSDEIELMLGEHKIKAKFVRMMKNLCLYEVIDHEKVYEMQEVCDDIMEFLLKNAKRPETDQDTKETEKQAIFAKGFNEMELV